MNLLGSAAYDPVAAVSKATSALLALTALDTTNLRLAITVPAHGKVKFIMRGTITGATTVPAILFGVLNGATVLKRAVPMLFNGTNSGATQDTTAVAEFVVTGLTPGAMNVDAAYGVQLVVAATNIKYGGPNDATGADAWGAFVFEAWDPQPIPTVAPGASGGLTIAGANAATTFATLTSTGAFSVNGVNAVSQTGDSFARVGAPVGASISADVAAVKTDSAAIKVQTDKLTFTVANQIDSNVLDWKSATAPAMTGDAFARLGAPAGASVSADVAAVRAAELTGAQMATAIWTDTVAADFTTALSIGKSVMNGTALGTGLHIALTDTLTTYTGNTPQTGDAFARVGAAGAGLTALGDTRIANLDATVSSRSTYAGGAVASVTAAVTVGTNNDKTGYALSAAGVQAVWDALTSALTTVGSIGKRIADNLDAAITSRMATYTQPTGFLAASFPGSVASPTNITAGVITTVTNLTNAPTAGDFTATMKTSLNSATPAVTVSNKTGFSLSAAGITAIWDEPVTGHATASTFGKLFIDDLDATISSRLATSGYTAPPSAGSIWDVVLSGHLTAGTTGNALNAAGAAGDPWTTALPGAYGAGTAGNIIGNRVDAAVSSRLATAGYTAPPSAAVNAAAVWNEATSGHATAGTFGKLGTDDNANITAVKAKTDNLPSDPADASDVAAAFTIVNNAIAALNNLSPAGVRAAIGLATGNLDTQLDALPTNAELAAALVGPLQANIKQVNGVAVIGNGHAGTEWGPA
jgi:hypothetical protein